MVVDNMQSSLPELPGKGSAIKGILLLLFGCTPLLLDDFIPPWGIPVSILAIWLILRVQGQSLATVGVVRPVDGWAKTILLGLIGAMFILALSLWFYPFLRELIGLKSPEITEYEVIEGNNSLLGIYLTVAWTTAGFGEEMIFRGFLMAGLARCLGASRTAWAASLVLSSLIFGLMHIRNGWGAVLSTGITGAVLAGLYLLSRRSIWAAYFAHGTVDTLAFLLIYTGLYKTLM
jgi:membrane protease YdiL (CAAX protease family)